MFKKKLFLSGKNTPTYFKLFRVLVLFCLIIFVSYGLVFTYGIIAQSNPVNDPFYCVYSPNRWNYIIPCVWLKDTGQDIVSAPNSRKYYPHSRLSETISYINSQNLPDVSLRASLISQCRYIKRPASDYNATVTSQAIINLCAQKKDSCLSDYPSGFFLHNLDLVKARFSSNLEIVNSANSIQQLISDLNCDDPSTDKLLTNLKDIHTRDLNLSRMTEQMPPTFNPLPIPPAPKPPVTPPTPPPGTGSAQFCIYSQFGSEFELPCSYFSELGLPQVPTKTPYSYNGYSEFDTFFKVDKNILDYLQNDIVATMFCQSLKRPISDFNVGINRIKSDNRSIDSSFKYSMVSEIFRKGIYLHILQDLVLRPQTSDLNSLVQLQANEIVAFNCNQSQRVVIGKLNVWRERDKSIAALSFREAPSQVTGGQVPLSYNPLFCTYQNPSDNKTYVVLCDYMRRMKLTVTPAISQVYVGNLRLSETYENFLNSGDKFDEDLLRRTCNYLKVEQKEFDDRYFGQNQDVMQVINNQNFFHTISLVSQNIENSGTLSGIKKNSIPTNQTDTRVIDFREDTALLDTAVDIKERKLISDLPTISRDDMLKELQSGLRLESLETPEMQEILISEFKVDKDQVRILPENQLRNLLSQKYLQSSRYVNLTDSQLRDLLKSRYSDTKDIYNLSTNEVFERIPNANSQVLVNEIISTTKSIDCNAQKEDLKNIIELVFNLDQTLSDLSKKNSSANSDKLENLKDTFNINF